jgi:polysaccharide pyruvyl transferase WcaK-like protein
MVSLSVHGFFGMKNFGDDLFCCAAEQVAGRHFPGARSFLAAPPLDGCGLESLFPQAIPTKWFSRPDALGAGIRMMTGSRAFTRTSTLVLAGGSVATRLAGVRRAQAHASRFLPKRWIALGISVGPFVNDADEGMVADFLRRFQFIGVRDTASLERCHDFGLADRAVMMGDLVALLRWPESPDTRTGGRVVMVPCRSASAGLWSNMVQLAVDSGHAVAVLSLNSHPDYGDDEIARDNHEYLAQSGVDSILLRYQDLGVADAWNLLGGARAVISGRLHGAISAYLQGVPFALIDYQEKCRTSAPTRAHV